MPVDSTHPDYDASLPAWLRARDVFAGEDAVKAAAEKYLPRLDCQDDKEYLAYKNRASFFNASARTADGFVGLIFRRDPTFKLPDKTSGVGDALDVRDRQAATAARRPGGGPVGRFRLDLGPSGGDTTAPEAPKTIQADIDAPRDASRPARRRLTATVKNRPFSTGC